MADLVVDDLKIRLGGNDILRGVSLTLQRGEVAALLGPSGSGKTTLLRAVAGLEQPWAGKINVGDEVVFDGAGGVNKPPEERRLGFVFQSYALWPHRTVAENVGYPLKLRGVAAAEQTSRIQRVLDSLGLGKLGHRYPHELSGGQQQRVAIARSLVYEPSVVLLDEPLSNLDAKLREEARAFLKELIKRENLAALMVTHDQAEALAISDKILLLNGGVVEQAGTPQQMYAAPRTLFTAEFMGSNNRLDGVLAGVEDDRAEIRFGAHALAGMLKAESKKAGDPASAVIRLEAMRVVDAPGANRLPLALSTSMYLGDHWEHVFRDGDLVLRCVTPGPAPEGRSFIELPADSVWIY